MTAGKMKRAILYEKNREVGLKKTTAGEG